MEVLVSTSAYQGRRIMVTGHTGFKGSWLTRWLTHLGARVSGLALPPASHPALFIEASLEHTLAHHVADVRDASAVQQIFASSRPELVFHLAAQSLVRASYEDPIGTYATNVMGTAHVLDAAQRCGAQGVVVVTSDKCYAPPPGATGYREGDALGGNDPYSSSKACAELVSASWRASFRDAGAPRIASARAGNVIGGGDWAADRLVPDLVRAALSGAETRIRHPHAIRPWQHVLEPLAGYLNLGARLLAGDTTAERAWNFGPAAADMTSVAHVADALCERLGGVWVSDTQLHPHEAGVLRLDSTDAQSLLRWQPRWSLPETLDLVADWYRRHHDGESAQVLMDENIAAYAALLEPAE